MKQYKKANPALTSCDLSNFILETFQLFSNILIRPYIFNIKTTFRYIYNSLQTSLNTRYLHYRLAIKNALHANLQALFYSHFLNFNYF